MDQRTRKLMTIYKALHHRDDGDRLYMSRKEGGRGLASTSIQRLEDYIQKRGGRLMTASRNNTDNTRTNRKTITKKQKWEEKQLYGHFKRLISNTGENMDVAKKKKGNHKRETESLLKAAQNNAILKQEYQSKNR